MDKVPLRPKTVSQKQQQQQPPQSFSSRILDEQEISNDDTFKGVRSMNDKQTDGRTNSAPTIKRLYHLPNVPRKYMSEGVIEEIEKMEARRKGRRSTGSESGAEGDMGVPSSKKTGRKDAGDNNNINNSAGVVATTTTTTGAASHRKTTPPTPSRSSSSMGNRSESVDSVASSVFMGGLRCETLLQMLCNEERSGGVFRYSGIAL